MAKVIEKNSKRNKRNEQIECTEQWKGISHRCIIWFMYDWKYGRKKMCLIILCHGLKLHTNTHTTHYVYRNKFYMGNKYVFFYSCVFLLLLLLSFLSVQYYFYILKVFTLLGKIQNSIQKYVTSEGTIQYGFLAFSLT